MSTLRRAVEDYLRILHRDGPEAESTARREDVLIALAAQPEEREPTSEERHAAFLAEARALGVHVVVDSTGSPVFGVANALEVFDRVWTCDESGNSGHKTDGVLVLFCRRQET